MKTYITPTVDVVHINYGGMLCTSGLSETLNADDIINTDNDMLAPDMGVPNLPGINIPGLDLPGMNMP